MYGQKLLDGLRAFEAMDLDRAETFGEYAMADERLEAMGYHPNVAASIIERLGRKGLIEWGVSARTGWLTEKGKEALSLHKHL